MKSAASVVVLVCLVFGAQSASAQDLDRYRDFVLGASLDEVIATSGAHPTDARTIHARPSTVHELIWRTAYVRSGAPAADPVRDIAFSFYDRALYKVIVSYDRLRTEGLTDRDVIDSLSAAYGPPVLASARSRFDVPEDAFPGSIVIARWQNADALLTLVRAEDAPEFQLILTARALEAQARSAIREAVRLDTAEAPRRELEQRKKDASDAAAAQDKARTTNKAAFRP